MSREKKAAAVDIDTVLDTDNVELVDETVETTPVTLKETTTEVDMITPVKESTTKPELTEDQKRIMSHQAIKAYYNS